MGSEMCIRDRTGGPQDGRWFWALQMDAEGKPYNSGTGTCATGKEAKEEVERTLSAIVFRHERDKLVRGEPSALTELEVPIRTPEDFEREAQRRKTKP